MRGLGERLLGRGGIADLGLAEQVRARVVLERARAPGSAACRVSVTAGSGS